jgi:hypothetical protein
LIGAGKTLVQEFESSITHGVMDVLGIVYPQYWMQLECDATFIKLTFYLGKTHKVDDQDMMVGELLNASDLDCQ